jgi:16S rRNA (guanine1207-N2)-methyltransferase
MGSVTDFSLDALRRYPDAEADNLFAVDASDRLILDQAAEAVASAASGDVVVIGDSYGGITLGAVVLHGARGVRVHQDSLLGEQSLEANAAGLTEQFRSLPLGAELVAGARVVLLRLPRTLSELDEIAQLIAAHAHPSVVVYAAGRIKHMSLGMNEVLSRHFGRLDVTRARQKSRGLVAREPHAGPARYPLREYHADLDLWICAHGGTFAGTALDIGTRLMLDVLGDAVPDAVRIVDLGCGTGALAVMVARARSGATVLASDVSAAAVASARATVVANSLSDRVVVVQDSGLDAQPEGGVDLVLLNPPFHVASTVHTGLAAGLFRDAARVLRPGGELWTVYNSGLDYRQQLERLVGPTRQVVRNTKFTVAASRR